MCNLYHKHSQILSVEILSLFRIICSVGLSVNHFVCYLSLLLPFSHEDSYQEMSLHLCCLSFSEAGTDRAVLMGDNTIL